MHSVLLISESLSEAEKPKLPEVPRHGGFCAVTGLNSANISRKCLFGNSFTDGALLAMPQSDRVSVEAYIALKYKWERMSSWICDGKTFRRLSRIEVREAVFREPPERPWAAYVTTSYKKHGALRSPINAKGKKQWLFETRIVDCSDINQLFDWWHILNDALRLGFGRTVLETLDCPSFIMRKIGLMEWMAFEKWALPRKNAALYAFLCYLLPSQKELKDEK